MKKFILAFLFCTAIASAQTVAEESLHHDSAERLLTQNDFKRSNGRMLVSSLDCRIDRDDSTCKFLVSVVCQEKVFSEIGVDRINEMILIANGKVRTAVSDENNYNPSEIKMAYNPQSKDWSLTNLFTTVDEFGLRQTELLALDFDSQGKFISMKRIF